MQCVLSAKTVVAVRHVETGAAGQTNERTKPRGNRKTTERQTHATRRTVQDKQTNAQTHAEQEQTTERQTHWFPFNIID